MCFVCSVKPSAILTRRRIMLIKGCKTCFPTTYIPKANCAITPPTCKEIRFNGGPTNWYYEASFVAYESMRYASGTQVEKTDRGMFRTT